MSDFEVTVSSETNVVSVSEEGSIGLRGSTGRTGPTGAVESFVSRDYYLDDTAAGITGYNQLLTSPDIVSSEEIDLVNNFDSGDGEVLIDQYISPPGSPGVNLWRGGSWHFVTYCNVDSTTGVTRLRIRVGKMTTGGVFTELFTFLSDEINTTFPTVLELDTESVQGDFIVNSTDRLYVRYYAVTTSTPDRDFRMYHNGTTHYSHIHSPISSSESIVIYGTGSAPPATGYANGTIWVQYTA